MRPTVRCVSSARSVRQRFQQTDAYVQRRAVGSQQWPPLTTTLAGSQGDFLLSDVAVDVSVADVDFAPHVRPLSSSPSSVAPCRVRLMRSWRPPSQVGSVAAVRGDRPQPAHWPRRAGGRLARAASGVGESERERVLARRQLRLPSPRSSPASSRRVPDDRSIVSGV